MRNLWFIRPTCLRCLTCPTGRTFYVIFDKISMLQKGRPTGAAWSSEDFRPLDCVILMTALGIAGHKGVGQETKNMIFCNSFHPVTR